MALLFFVVIMILLCPDATNSIGAKYDILKYIIVHQESFPGPDPYPCLISVFFLPFIFKQ